MNSSSPLRVLVVLAAAVCLAGSAWASLRVPVPGAGPAPEVGEHPDLAQSLGLYAPPVGEPVSPGLLARAARDPGARAVVWVFLTDKGMGTRASYGAALVRARRDLTPRAARRRRALGPDLGLDFRDLPVDPRYVRALADAGYRVRRESRWLNAVSLEAPAGDVPSLARFAFVRRVIPVRGERKVPLPVPAPSAGGVAPLANAPAPGDSLERWFYGPAYEQLDQIQILDLHRRGYTGAGVLVEMIDTGFLKTHPAMTGAHVVAEYDFINQDGDTQNQAGDTDAQQYHGTGTWSEVGGYAPGALIGGAFGADFLLAKTEDVTREVRSEEDNYVAALEWGDSLGVDVTSASLGYWTFDDSTGYTKADMDGNTGVITVAVDIAVGKGICCVNAAGNAGPADTTVGTPADADSVISVGAVDSLGVVQSFSSRGPTADGRIKPEVCARGRSTRWAQAWTGTYGSANGTSLATPLVASLAALLKEAHPGWTGYDVRQALIATATRSATPDNAYGYGIARGTAALDYAGVAPAELSPPRATLPFALCSPAGGDTVGTDRPLLVWSRSAPAPGDTVSYTVYLAADSTFSGASVYAAGSDTSFAAPDPLTPGGGYVWRVEAVSEAGYLRRSMNTGAFTVSPAVTAVPGPGGGVRAFAFAPAFPNPTRGPAAFTVRLPERTTGTLSVVGVDGRLVRRFAVAGTGADAVIRWDGRDAEGRALPAGIYFARLRAPGFSQGRKIVRLP